MIRCPGAVPRGPGLCPERRETAPRQPRLGAVRGSTLGLPRGPCPGAPRLGAVPHLNNTLRTISDHARRFGGGQWSNRSVSRWSSEHGPGHRGRSGLSVGVVSGQAKVRLLPRDCPESRDKQTTPRSAPRSAPTPKPHVPRASFHAAPVELVDALNISHEIRSGKVGVWRRGRSRGNGGVFQCAGAGFRGFGAPARGFGARARGSGLLVGG